MRGGGGISRNGVRIGMRGVDQHVDALLDQMIREPGDAAEAADANRHALRRRRGSTAGERQRDDKIGAARQALRQHSRLRRAAEDENFCLGSYHARA